MQVRQGVQAEILISLALIMFTATALLLVIFLETHRARIDALHPILARGFVVESRRLPSEFRGIEGAEWWHLDAAGRESALPSLGATSESGPLDDSSRELALEALRSGSAHVRSGAPWHPIRLASPDPLGDGVLVGRIDAPLSGAAWGGLIGFDLVVFGLFGFFLLSRRVVGPLGRLSASVREMGRADGPTLIPVEGAGEVAELATAFNDVQADLAARTGSLEKAVGDLREANGRLVTAREGLDRAERLAMVGSMAAGVAHEVGNPMGALLAFLDLAGRDPGLSGESKHCLDRASEQGERVRVILRQLLDFSRSPQPEVAEISIEEVADQVVELVSAQQEYAKIEIEVVADAGLAPARGDRSLSSQILLNLVLNAAAALEEVAEPKIRLRVTAGARAARSTDDGDEWTRRRRMDTIECRVEDSGPGVRLENPSRIFDPFFTTKDPGKGTGLGLANALRLAEEMGGFVRLEAEPSTLGGACFVFGLRSARETESKDGGVRRAGRD